MPKFKVEAKYVSIKGIEIEAKDEESAKKLEGEIISEQETNSYFDGVESIEQVPDDKE